MGPLTVNRTRVNRLLRQAEKAGWVKGRVDITHLSDAELRQFMAEAKQEARPHVVRGAIIAAAVVTLQALALAVIWIVLHL